MNNATGYGGIYGCHTKNPFWMGKLAKPVFNRWNWLFILSICVYCLTIYRFCLIWLIHWLSMIVVTGLTLKWMLAVIMHSYFTYIIVLYITKYSCTLLCSNQILRCFQIWNEIFFLCEMTSQSLTFLKSVKFTRWNNLTLTNFFEILKAWRNLILMYILRLFILLD